MERTLLNELNKRNLDSFVDRARDSWLKRSYWRQFFGLKPTTQLTWESLAGSGGTPVMADVVEYNASMPLKSRKTITKRSGDIPKLGLKFRMDEKDYNDYMTMKALAGGDLNRLAILDIVFGDVEACFDGVMARTEHLCMQALSYGKLTLDANNNNGIITETDVDFGIPSGNKTAVGTIWETSATATPLKDIRNKVKAAKSNGHKITQIVMDDSTFDNLVATTEAKESFAAFRGVTDKTKQFLMLQEINMYLSNHRLPPIMVVDSSVQFEGRDHSKTSIDTWKTGYVAFLTNKMVGNVRHGPIMAENSAAIRKKAIMTKRDHVLIYKFSELEPPAEFTIGQANAFPTFNDVDSIYLLLTTATTWS